MLQWMALVCSRIIPWTRGHTADQLIRGIGQPTCPRQYRKSDTACSMPSSPGASDAWGSHREHLPKDHMLVVKVGCGTGGEEELGAIGVGSSICHGEQVRAVMLEREAFILKFLPIH